MLDHAEKGRETADSGPENAGSRSVGTKRAAIYMRTSTVEQHPENQLNACRAFAHSRGYHVSGEYIEQLSGWKQDVERPKYEEVKRRAHAGEIDAVIVWALDRWARNMDRTLEDVAFFATRGVKFHSVQESWLEEVNVEGPLGEAIRRFLYGMKAAMAQMESDRLSERTKAGLERARAKGKRLGGKPAQFNRYRAAQLLKEGWSLRQIASELGVSAATVMRFKRSLGEES